MNMNMAIQSDNNIRLVPTVNQMGYMFKDLTKYDKEFIEFSASSGGPVLEIGAAFGWTTLKVASKKVKIVANDLSKDHLTLLKETTRSGLSSYITPICARFPKELNFRPSSFTAVLVSNVFHYLGGQDILLGIEKLFHWLKSGGKAYIIVGTPYSKMWREFVPIFESNIEKNMPWPGYVEDVSIFPNNNRLGQLPEFMHFIPLPLLINLFQKQGFFVEKSGFCARPTWPDDMQLDGRESACLVAIKP